MAVLPLNLSISAEVLIDGKPAAEHPDYDDIEIEHDNHQIVEYQKNRTVSTYIECEADTVFSLRFSAGEPDAHKGMKCSHLGFFVTIDGNKAGHVLCSRAEFKKNKRMVGWTGEMFAVKDEIRPRSVQEMDFRFAKIVVGECPLLLCCLSSS
jgi:hypothetical protein